ncbi:MAG: permease [Lachnospiraceae bacterium]|nr:permease [Lachnospiraceae bacterium]
MTLFDFGSFSLSVTSVSFLVFTVFVIAAVGYALGRISIKGVELGTAGVFIIALVYGCFFYNNLETQLTVSEVSFVSNALKIVENMGLILFVTSVGFIAGPSFVANFKKNFKSYVLLGLIIILLGALSCVACIYIGRGFTDLENDELTAMMVGLLSGSLTSTPAFSAAKATVSSDLESIVAVGHGIAYLFGVIGVVLFVQIVPKIMHADMNKERELLRAGQQESRKLPEGLLHMDEFGFMPFSLAAFVGILVGSIKIGNFSLTTTGGCLLMGLVFGHFGHFGKMSVTPSAGTLKVFRELGLMMFLIGAGVAGGASFVKYFQAVYFVYGIIMTIVPMIVGFLVAKFVMKLPLLNNLGSITGGMTSTPALGTLINVSGTDDVANAYAATYPVALIAVVLASQFIILLCS